MGLSIKTYTYILASLAIVFIFFLQSKSTNFREGNRGWVTSHSLAIADKATVSNGLVGYACRDDESGYSYFDRNPILFSALSQIILNTQVLPSQKILISQNIMNVVYVTIFVLAFFIIKRYLPDTALSLSLIFLISSGTLFLPYKDMFHFESPSLMGMTTFLLGLKLYEDRRISRIALMVIAVMACLTGQGYATGAVILLWSLLEIRRRNFAIPLLCLCISTTMIAGALFYNVKTEAIKRNVTVWETGVVASAKARTGVVDYYSAPWKKFIQKQARRIIQGIYPLALDDTVFTSFFKRIVQGKTLENQSDSSKDSTWNPYFQVVLLTSVLVILFFTIHGMILDPFKNPFKGHDRTILVTILLSGFAYVIPMKHLSYYHEYTHMYCLGFYIVAGIYFMSRVQNRYTVFVLTSSAILFAASLYSVKRKYDLEESGSPNYTADLDTIRTQLDKRNVKYVNVESLKKDGHHRGVPYAHCFYIGDRIHSIKSPWVIDSHPRAYGFVNLTTENKHYFLLSKEVSGGGTSDGE